jgi:hypothetical protein
MVSAPEEREGGASEDEDGVTGSVAGCSGSGGAGENYFPKLIAIWTFAQQIEHEMKGP